MYISCYTYKRYRKLKRWAAVGLAISYLLSTIVYFVLCALLEIVSLVLIVPAILMLLCLIIAGEILRNESYEHDIEVAADNNESVTRLKTFLYGLTLTLWNPFV